VTWNQNKNKLRVSVATLHVHCILNIFMWFCKAGHLANSQESGSRCWQRGSGASSGGTAEGPVEGGTLLLSDDGQYSGL